MEPEARPGSDRLDSWKEIAAHLSRGLRTVQRWEREEALPVRRHLHSKLGSVYALKSDLAAWRLAREKPARPPVGHATGRSPEDGAPVAVRRGSLRWPVGAAVVAAALLATTHSSGRPAAISATDSTAHRVAVVPFRNLTGDPSADRLIEGLTDDTLAEMHRILGVRLAVVSVRADERNEPEALRAGGIEYVLEGSVRQAGDQLRIAARLVREADGSLLWAATYDRPFRDGPVAQADVGRSIATGVTGTLR